MSSPPSFPYFFVAIVCFAGLASLTTAVEDVVHCIFDGEDGCLEVQFANVLRRAEFIPSIRITRHLTIIKNQQGNENAIRSDEETMLERLERYLYSHSVRLVLPQELIEGARGLVDNHYLDSLPKEITLPLAAAQDEQQGRGFVRKVVIPFLLGLKFKATAVIPIAMALIALKTWKALTLGLLSIVLSGALVIFKLTRPKVHNYEIYYPPSHHHIISDHPAHYERARDYADSIAYSGHY